MSTREQAKLLQRHNKAYIEEDTGHIKRPREDPRQGVSALDVDMTVMYCSPRRTTSNVDILLHEARQVDRGDTVGNPAEPFDSDVEEQARKRFENEDLSPAWEQDGGET